MFYYPISTLVNLTETREQWSRDSGEKGNRHKLFLTGGWWLKHPKESEITRTAEQSLLALMSQKSGISSSWTAFEQNKTTALEILFFTRSIINFPGWILALLVSVKMHLQGDAKVLLERPSCLLGFSFWYNNPHLRNAGRVRTQIRISETESADYPTTGIAVTHYSSQKPFRRACRAQIIVFRSFFVYCNGEEELNCQKAKPRGKILRKIGSFNVQLLSKQFFFLLMESESQRPDKKKVFFVMLSVTK